MLVIHAIILITLVSIELSQIIGVWEGQGALCPPPPTKFCQCIKFGQNLGDIRAIFGQSFAKFGEIRARPFPPFFLLIEIFCHVIRIGGHVSLIFGRPPPPPPPPPPPGSARFSGLAGIRAWIRDLGKMGKKCVPPSPHKKMNRSHTLMIQIIILSKKSSE